MKYKSRVIVPHVKECFAKGRKHEWSGIPVGTFFGNYCANDKARRGSDHFWIKVSCNDPKCPAIKAVHSNVLADT